MQLNGDGSGEFFNEVDSADPWLIRAGSVLLPPGELASGMDVLIEGDRIRAVVPSGTSPVDEERLILAPDATLIPGLIDTHVHLTFSGDDELVDNVQRDAIGPQLARATGNAQEALSRGITTIVDCGGHTEALLALRSGLERGLVQGPRLLVSGAPITTTAGHCHWLGGTADTVEEVISRARGLAAAGVDLIKVMVTGGNITAGSNPARLQYPEAVLGALAEECGRLGKPLVAHAHSAEGVELAARIGARVVAHATCADQDGEVSLHLSVVEALAAAGTYVDPTLMVGARSAVSPSVPDARRGGNGTDAGPPPRRQVQRQAMLPVFAAMHQGGVRLLSGTDAGVPGVPHGSVADSVVALHTEVGLDIAQALGAATSRAAAAFGLGEEVGEIRAGLRADLLLLDGRLRDGMAVLHTPGTVWRAGRLVARHGLVRYDTGGPVRARTT
jgi:imidazolonepropionase-like amidohydrolase